MPDDKKEGIVSGGGSSLTSDKRASGIVSGGGSQLSSREDQTLQTYTVVKGDSLSKIAKSVYGKGSLWPKIFEANKDQVKNPDLIFPGQILRIPE